MTWLKKLGKFLFITQNDMVNGAKQDIMVMMNNDDLSKNDKIKCIQHFNNRFRSLRGKYSGMTEISSMRMAEFDNKMLHKLGIKETELDKCVNRSLIS